LSRPAGRPPAKYRPTDRRVLPDAAAQVNLIRFELGATVATPGRALEPDVGDPVVSTGVRAAVHAERQRLDLTSEAFFQPLDDLLHLRLRLGHREVAERLTGTGDARP